MKQKHIFLLILCIACSAASFAQKSIYIPEQMKSEGYSESDESKQWCKKRSRESDNIIVFWADGYGQNDPNSDAVPSEYRVDIDDLLAKLESFYDLNINVLKFAETGVGKSNLDKYKMVICLYYTTEWMAYGSGFDNLIGGMWISPSTCHPVGSTIAHEMGHSFQYQCQCDLGGYAGFRYEVGQGSTYWEQTAQWQSFQPYPEEALTNYNMETYMSNHHKAISHEDQRYASYLFHYYQAEKHGIDIIGRIWRGNKVQGADQHQVYMAVTGISSDEFYAECYDAAARFATWDLNALRDMKTSYVGKHHYNFIDLGNGKMQVAYASAPQSTGYNLVPLQIPENGGEIATVFTAMPVGEPLADGDPGVCNKNDDGSFETVTNYNTFEGADLRGFRVGYVALTTDGERVYNAADTVYGKGSGWTNDTLRFVVPENTERLWLVVSPAPSSYIVHKWDEEDKNDDQWPYQLSFENTGIEGHVSITDPEGAIADATITLNVNFPLDATGHSGADVTISGKDLQTLGNAFKMQPKEIAGLMKSWSASPADGSVTLWALAPNSLELENSGSTANGHGHWFDASGKVNTYYNSLVYSEFNPNSLTFTVGQFPGKLTDGQKITFGQALRLNKNGQTATFRIIFNVTAGTPATTHTATAISQPSDPNRLVDVYAPNGTLLLQKAPYQKALNSLPNGLYIIDGKMELIDR